MNINTIILNTSVSLINLSKEWPYAHELKYQKRRYYDKEKEPNGWEEVMAANIKGLHFVMLELRESEKCTAGLRCESCGYTGKITKTKDAFECGACNTWMDIQSIY
jgi:protein-arginine kinase activator protein McsA